MRCMKFLFISVLLFLLPHPLSAGWFWSNPKPQGNQLRAVCFVDNNTGYAVGQWGTILKTSDGGANWTLQSSGTTQGLVSVQFPLNATTGYAVGGKGQILKTTNGGYYWKAQTSGDTTANFLSVHFPVGSDTGFVSGQWGVVFKTTDGGQAWVRQNTGVWYTFFTVQFPKGASTGYVAGDQNQILKTIDGGRNWFWVHNGVGELYSMDFPTDALTGYFVGVNGAIVKTSDGGYNWINQNSGTTNPLYAVQFPTDAQTGYAAGAGGIILKTTDGGASWSVQPSGTPNALFGIHFPVNATTGYAVGDVGTMLKTTDGGATWFNLSAGPVSDLNSVLFPVDAQIGYAVGANGNILKTTNGGGSWLNQNSPTNLNLYGVDFPVDAATGFIVGGSGSRTYIILKTTDGGINWVTQLTGSGYYFTAVHFPTDAVTGYVVGYDPNRYPYSLIFKTTDGGANWIYLRTVNYYLNSIHFPENALTGYVVGGNGYPLKTTDGGANWGQMNCPGGTSVYFPAPQTGYITGGSGVYKTTDSGATWLIQDPNVKGWSVHFPVNDQTGYVVGGSAAIHKTTNGGSYWFTQTSGTTYSLQSVHFPVDANTGYAVGVNGTILKTTDGGNPWETPPQRPDLDVYKDSLELHGARMDFGQVRPGSSLPELSFALVNTDPAHNPDPDGPSEDTLLTNVHPVRARLWGPNRAYMDAMVSTPPTLRRGVVQLGTVALNVPGNQNTGFYQGSFMVIGDGRDLNAADSFLACVEVQSFADLDIDNDSLDLKGNLMDFGRVAAGSPDQVKSFQLLNTNGVNNPDPDGPSLDTLLTGVRPVTVTLTSPSDARLNAVVNVPQSLRQGYTETGTVGLLIPGNQPPEVYRGTIVIQGTGRDTSDMTSDSFSVRVEVRPIQELTKFTVAPNPFIPQLGHTSVCFYGLPTDALIRIYDLSGLLVKELPKNPGESFVVWDPLHNPKVASGVYIFCVFSGKKEIHRGKLAVIN